MADKANILVVDDERGPRESLHVILKPYYNVYTAEKGEEAIRILDETPIDLVTLDLRMPGATGTEILKKVKERDPDIEAIIITGYGSMETAVEGLRLGAFDYIAKPFDVKQILALVERALERRHAKLKLAQEKEAERNRAERAEAASRLRRQLVSALAHDIKTLLGVVMISTDSLTFRLKERARAGEEMEFLSHIHDNAQRIVKLVAGFLDAAKIEAGLPIARQPVEINRLIREVSQQHRVALREKSLTLRLELDERLPKILGDQPQLERVLWNLIGNAVKFTPLGGEIAVISRLENDQACIEVKDTGVGIPRDELPLLFSEFRRLRGSGNVEGTGLGLFVVKTIVDAHGGKVAAESTEGKGTTFVVRLPTESPPKTSLQPPRLG